MKKGEITAFLSLTFVLLVSFVLGILEITVIQTEKNMSRLVVDRAVFSMFGEYHQKLMEDYHIFSIEGSYGTGEFSEEKIIGRMQYYGAAGMKNEITGIQYLTDMGGQPLREQVLQYMEDSYGISVIRNFTGLTSEWEEEALNGADMEEKEQGILDEVNDLMENAQIPEDAGNEEAETDKATEIRNGAGLFSCIDQIDKTGILSVVMPEDMELSGLETDTDRQVSNRDLNAGRGTFPVRQEADGIEERLLFNEYILNTFFHAVSGKYENDPSASQDRDGTEGRKRSLLYEIEYILEGKASDKENLEAFLMKLFFVRMAVNYVYLQNAPSKKAEVSSLATAVTAVLMIPETAEILSQLILLAWAAGESVADIRTLLSGKRAATVKNDDTWQLPLFSLLTIGNGTAAEENSDVPDGISYKDYLRIFLFLEKSSSVNMRVLDRIEENMKTEYSMDYFRADRCITKLETENTAEIAGGITYLFPCYFGYE